MQKLKNKIILLIIIILICFYSMNESLANNLEIKLGKNKTILMDKNKNGYEIDLIDLQIILFTIFGVKTYNEDFDKILLRFYQEKKDLIEQIRYDFYKYLYQNFKNTKIYKNSLFSFFYYYKYIYDLDEEQYNIYKLRFKNIDIKLIDSISYMLNSSFLNLSFQYIFSKVYALSFYDMLVNFIILNRNEISEVFHNNTVIEEIYSYFDNFLSNFQLDKIVNDYIEYYSINISKDSPLSVYFLWYDLKGFPDKDNKYFETQGLYVEQQSLICISGISNINKVKSIFLHELSHYFFSNLIEYPRTDKGDMVLEHKNAFLYTVLESENSSTDKETKEKIIKEINSTITNYRYGLLKELIADTSVLYFIKNNKNYCDLENDLFLKKYLVEYKPGTFKFKIYNNNLYQILVGYIVSYFITKNIALEKIIYTSPENMEEIIYNLVNNFIKNDIQYYFDNIKWLYIP